MAKRRVAINAVAFKEGDSYVIQGIEFDIVAHADDVMAVPDAFGRAVAENILIARHLGRQPLEGIGPAPERFRKLFESAPVEVRTTKKKSETDPDIAVRVLAA
jgi:hypothetical protein